MDKLSSEKMPTNLQNQTNILGYQNFFPYKSFRPEQEKIISEISESIALGKNSILIAPNGVGKTIMALAAALPISLIEKKRKIIFCSRTFSQNARVVVEAQEITKKFAKKNIDRTLGVISIRGRNEMCPHKLLNQLKLPPSESMNVCSSLRKNKKCKYFRHLMKKRKNKDFKENLKNIASMPMNALDIIKYSESEDFCPYFLTKMLLEYEDIIVCNYQWIFEPFIRETFLETLGSSLKDSIIIMDECHNLPEMANGISSFKMSPYTLRQALKDLEVYHASYKLISFVRNLRNMVDKVKKRIKEETGLDSHRFIQQILNKNNFSSLKDLRSILLELEDYGDAIETEKIDQGKNPRNHISTITTFFDYFLKNLDNPAYFPCVTSKTTEKGKSVTIELKCLSPRLITDPIFNESFATLSLSGTLHPFTYINLLGLNESGKMLKINKMGPLFPKKNLRVLLTKHLNTKGMNRTDAMYRDILVGLKPILENTPKNIGVFCASYEVVNGLWKNGFKKLAKLCNKKVFREKSGLSANDNEIIIENYKFESRKEKKNGAVLLGVCGGRNSEGEDFPGDEMNAVIIVGIPFQRPTPSGNAKIEYYEKLFPKKGRIFGYTVPALNRSNQACGRPIRRMQDRGLIVLMDFRFWNYKEYLSDWVKKSMRIIPYNQKLIEQEVLSFYTGNFF